MNQSLREEIKESIQQNFDPDFVYVIVDEILKIIEDRIDSKIKQIHERGLYYDDMKTRGLEEFKEEMLKS